MQCTLRNVNKKTSFATQKINSFYCIDSNLHTITSLAVTVFKLFSIRMTCTISVVFRGGGFLRQRAISDNIFHFKEVT